MLLDPKSTKIVEINDLKITIKPLRPIDQRPILAVWANVPLEADKKELGAYMMSKVDYVALAEAILPGIVEINTDRLPDGHSLKDTTDIKELLSWFSNADLTALSNELTVYMGMSEEERKNSLSSSESATPELNVDARTTAKEEKEPVSNTIVK